MSRRGKVAIVMVVLSLWFGAGLGPLLRPLLYTLTPLQRYYLGAYMASSWKASRVGATTEVRWIYKARAADPQTKPQTNPKPTGKRKRGTKPVPRSVPELAYFYAEQQDLTAMPLFDTVWNGNALPFLLSADAEREGWTGLRQGFPRTMASGETAAFLRERYFDDESWWRYFTQPALTLALLWVLVLIAREQIASYRARYPWDRPQRRYEFRRELLWQWMFEPQGVPPRLAAERAAPLQIEAAFAPEPRVPVAPQAPAAPVRTVPPPSPGSPPEVSPKPKAAFVWDESQGID